MRRLTAAVVSVLVFAFAACGGADEPEAPPESTAVHEADVKTTNGWHLNDTSLNGWHLNTSSLGATLAAVRLADVTLNNGPLQSAWLQGGELRGQRGILTFQGTDLVGATLTGELDGGGTVALRIASAAPDPSGAAGVWRYSFEYQRPDGTWGQACASGDSVIVSGRWNYGQGVPGGGAFTQDSSVFTVGCTGSAIAKCVGLGYRPWQTFSGVSGTSLHVACTRAIRADFCGDGRSWTTNGRLINIYDDVGVQADTQWWTAEAEWTSSGARCVSAIARNLLGITCSNVLTTLSCGAKWHFDTGTLLMTETLTGPIGISLF